MDRPTTSATAVRNPKPHCPYYMKTPALSLLLSCLLLPQLFAGPGSSPPRLTGIVNLPTEKVAWLDWRPCINTPLSLVLGERQREGDLAEVIRIDPATGIVELRLAWTNAPITVSLPRHGNPLETAAGSLELVDADIDPVLGLYAECKGRTLLRWPRLPATSFSVVASTTNQAQAALALEKALAEKGISIIPDGEKFLMVVPESEATTVKPHASDIKPAISNGSKSEPIPAGAIYFPNTDLLQVAQIYADLIGRKLAPDQPLPRPTLAIKFKNQTPLDKAECVYALETLFRWQGVKLVPVAQDVVRIAPLSDASAGRVK